MIASSTTTALSVSLIASSTILTKHFPPQLRNRLAVDGIGRLRVALKSSKNGPIVSTRYAREVKDDP